MDNCYPSPQEAGVRIPFNVKKDRFCAGFKHGLSGGQLNQVEYMKLSFRTGFRAAKLYLRELRRSQECWSFLPVGKSVCVPADLSPALSSRTDKTGRSGTLNLKG